MTRNVQKIKIEYGDFQTPLELTQRICNKLVQLGVNPDIIIEPTCGIGNFIQAASHFFPSANQIIGIEINPNYLNKIQEIIDDKRIQIQCQNLFDFDWLSIVYQQRKEILVIGNFPWVTNSQQGYIGGNNLPLKSNFQNHNGLDAITGKSNFDISEWMLIHVIQWLHNCDSYLAMLCKTSVSRKILSYIHSQKLHLAYCATYKIDAKKYFDANVDACLLFCKFDDKSKNYFCDVFDGLENLNYCRIGYRHNILIRDLTTFHKLEKLYTKKSETKWRSGIKHDCANVMEFRQIGQKFVNGLGEIVDLESTYIFPLIKGSSVANNQTKSTNKYVLVPQTFVGESTEKIKESAPKTWKYLNKYEYLLNKRKSKIYQNNPKFSIFGVGSYSFAPWKIAICGLYKKLDFRLIGKINEKPVIFDDTIYFLSFDNEVAANETLENLNSPLVKNFYSSLIFWDEKRPIKSSILNSLNFAILR